MLLLGFLFDHTDLMSSSVGWPHKGAHTRLSIHVSFSSISSVIPFWILLYICFKLLWTCSICHVVGEERFPITWASGEAVLGSLMDLFSLCVLQVLWPPRSMAKTWEKQLLWKKWFSKIQREAASPKDQLVGREDAQGPVSPTRGQCHSRARWVPPQKVFFSLQSTLDQHVCKSKLLRKHTLWLLNMTASKKQNIFDVCAKSSLLFGCFL